MVPMQFENLDETRPVEPETPSETGQETAATDIQPVQDGADEAPSLAADDAPEEKRKSSKLWLLWVFLGLLGLGLVAAGSAYGGYRSAVKDRTDFQSTQVAGEAQAQFELALKDMQAKQFDLARQRLEYIINLDPNYPGAADALTAVLLEQRITATPTNAPTPTLSPTPDYRGRDELYSQAQASMVASDWSTAIDTLLTLRKKYPDYMAIKVDGILYVALRNRGIDKIAKQADLEGGTYDLTLAERFGPLDAEAKNWRDWAELYIRGASFWDVDWSQAVYYFSQLASSAPNLSDASGWTASNRYLDALLGYGDWLSARGQWCDAQVQYDTYLSLLANPQVEPTASHANDKCSHGGNEPPTETPTPGGEPESIPAGATPTPTPTDTAQPAQSTPTPTATPQVYP